MRDEDESGSAVLQLPFEPYSRADVEVIGGRVEEQEVVAPCGAGPGNGRFLDHTI